MVNGIPGWPGYYLSAYGIAVKHGYTGTEEEWLESLRGAGTELQYENGILQWRNIGDEEWNSVIDLGRIVDEFEAEKDRAKTIVDQVKAEAKNFAEIADAAIETVQKAAVAKDAAESAAAQAQEAQTEASAAAGSARKSGAYAKEQGDRAAELIEEIKNTDVGDLAAEVAGMRSAMPGVLIEDIEIPTAGWAEDSTLTAYPYAAVVNMEKSTAQMSPVVALKPGSLETARAACLCPSVEAQDGAIKLWAKKVPAADMIATVTLLSEGAVQSSGGESPSGSYVLPVATRTRLGGVKIGSDVDIAADGTISVNTDEITATDEEVQEMLENTLQ